MNLKELLEKRSKLKEEARDLIDTDFAKAQEKYKELEKLNKDIEKLEEEERMRNAFSAGDDGDKSEEGKDGDNEPEKRRRTPKAPDFEPEKKNKESDEMRAFRNYIEKREISGDVKTDDGFVIIPKEIVSEVQKLMEAQFNFSQHVSVKSVSNAAGEYPVIRLGQVEGMAEVEELEENPKLAVQPLSKIDYKIKTYRGFIRVSQETIEDAGIDTIAELKEWLARIVLATKNKAVTDVLTNGSTRGTATVKFTEVPAEGADGLKTVKNVKLDASYVAPAWYLNQNAYDAIDKLKDGNGRYLLQDSIAAESGKTLLGKPVVTIPNSTFTGNEEYHVFYGVLSDAITLFDRSQMMAQWTDYMHFGQGLMAAVRQDARVNDEKALLKVDFTLPAPPVADGGDENPDGA